MSGLYQDQITLARQNLGELTGASIIPASLPNPMMEAGRGVKALVPVSAGLINNVCAINVDNGQPDNTAAVASFFNTNPPPITYTIKAGSLLGQITSLVLRFQITGSATPATLLPTFMWFQKILIKSNNGSQDFETYANAHEIMLDFVQSLKAYEMSRWAAMHNVNTDLTQKGAIAVGANNFYLSLKNTLLNSIKLNPSLLKGDIQIQFWPAPFSQLATAGTTADATMTNISLYVNIDQYNSADAQAQVAKYANSPAIYPFLSPKTQLALSGVSITSGVPLSFNLGNVPDLIGGLYVIAVDSRLRAQDLYATVDFSDATFQLSDNSNNILQPSMPGSYLAYDQVVEKGVQVFFNSTNPVKFWPVMTVLRNYDAAENGQIDGCYYIKGTEKVTITPAATLANTYNIYYMLLSYRTAKLVNGSLTSLDQ